MTPVSQIKRGQYKRCQIGSELIKNPVCICLENPFYKLLYHEKIDIMKTLKKLSHRGLTIVFTFKV